MPLEDRKCCGAMPMPQVAHGKFVVNFLKQKMSQFLHIGVRLNPFAIMLSKLAKANML